MLLGSILQSSKKPCGGYIVNEMLFNGSARSIGLSGLPVYGGTG